MIKIVWQDIWNRTHEKEVSEERAEAEAERIRTLADVKADTVKIVRDGNNNDDNGDTNGENQDKAGLSIFVRS